MERQDIYEHHKQTQVALAAVKTVSVATHTAVVAAGAVVDVEYDDAGGEGDPAASVVVDVVLYDFSSSFLG